MSPVMHDSFVFSTTVLASFPSDAVAAHAIAGSANMLAARRVNFAMLFLVIIGGL
jgi:hypothetical protein